MIYNVLRTLFYHCKDPEKLRVVLLEPTRISGVNIFGTTIHYGLILGLNDKSKSSLWNRLSEVKSLIIV